MQSRKQSGVESIANVLIGLLTSFLIQLIIYPAMGIQVSMNQNVAITIIFFAVSFVRGYFLRRYFNSKVKKNNDQY